MVYSDGVRDGLEGRWVRSRVGWNGKLVGREGSGNHGYISKCYRPAPSLTLTYVNQLIVGREGSGNHRYISKCYRPAPSLRLT